MPLNGVKFIKTFSIHEVDPNQILVDFCRKNLDDDKI